MSAIKQPRTAVDTDETEIDETLSRISSQKGVLGLIVLNHDGVVLRTTLDQETAGAYATLVHSLTIKSRLGVRDLDPSNDLTFFRLRTKKHEIMVAPDKDYILCVIQNPNYKEGQPQEMLRVRTLPESVDDDNR